MLLSKDVAHIAVINQERLGGQYNQRRRKVPSLEMRQEGTARRNE
jgi:hypothetical protein